MKNKKTDRWRLETSALNQQFNEFRDMAGPSFKGVIPYHNRHTSATNQHERGADFGLSGEAIAQYNNHSYAVALDWYIAPLRGEVEIICRYPDELIVFCEQMIVYSISQILLRPWQILRHFAAIIAWMQLLGRTQLREQLKAYRLRRFDLPDHSAIENTWKKTCIYLQRRGHRSSIGNVIRFNIRQVLNRDGYFGCANAQSLRRFK